MLTLLLEAMIHKRPSDILRMPSAQLHLPYRSRPMLEAMVGDMSPAALSQRCRVYWTKGSWTLSQRLAAEDKEQSPCGAETTQEALDHFETLDPGLASKQSMTRYTSDLLPG
jgi:hypothetical protein